MPRVLFVLLWLGISVYAIADWSRTSEDEMPGRLPRMVWLCILVATVPLLSVGSIAWILMRKISSAEKTQRESRGRGTTGTAFPWSRPATSPSAPVAPDDNPDFLFSLKRDIQRRRREIDREDEPGEDHNQHDRDPYNSQGNHNGNHNAESTTNMDSQEVPSSSDSSPHQQKHAGKDHEEPYKDQQHENDDE